MSVNANRLDYALAAVKAAWFAAPEGSAERKQLDQQANQLRSEGASEAVANFLQSGSTSGQGLQYAQQYAGASWTPEADLAQRLAAAVATPQTPTSGTNIPAYLFQSTPAATGTVSGQYNLSGTTVAPELLAQMQGWGLTPEQIQSTIDYNRQWAADPQMRQEYFAGRTEQKQAATQFETEMRAITALGDTPEAAQRLSAISGLTPEQAQANITSTLAGVGKTTGVGTTTGTTTGVGKTTGTGVGTTTTGRVEEMKLPTYTPQTPAQVDLSRLGAAGPQQPITMPTYKTPSTEELRTGIAGMTSITAPTATTPQTFMASDLQKAIASQAQGQAPAPMQAQFGTPEQFGQYVAQTQQMLQPYTDAQKTAATAAFNQAMQTLGGQWAARGMLASGAAGAQQQQAAQGFGIQMGLLEAQQLEQAINTALQAGQLSTAEAQAIWNQSMTGTQFGQQQAVTQAQMLQQAVTSQEQQRLAEQGLGLNVQQARSAQEQAQTAALQSALGLETQQGQFGATLGLQTQQLEMQRQQQLATNLAQQLGMQIQQGQWGAEFDFAQEKEIFSRAVTSQQLDFQERQEAQKALQWLTEMEVGQSQWAQTFGLTEAGTTGVYKGVQTQAAQEQAAKLKAALEKQQWDQAMDTWQAELKISESEFDQWLKTETLKLDKAKASTEAGYKAYLKKMGLTEQQGTMATNGYMTQILNQPTAEAAFQYLVQNADAIVNDGANVTTILQNLKYKWPEFYATTGGGAITSEEVKKLFGPTP